METVGVKGPPQRNELDLLLLRIRTTITRLFRLSTLIRRQQPRGRSPSSEVVHVPADVTFVKDRYPKTRHLPWLATRLGNATTQRREYINHRQAYRKSLASHPRRTAPLPPVSRRIIAKQTKSSFLKRTNVTKAIPRQGGARILHEESTPVPSPSPTSSSASISTFSSMATICRTLPGIETEYDIADLTESRLNYVQLRYDHHFECPWCRTIQLVSSHDQWRYVTAAHRLSNPLSLQLS